MNQYYPHVFQKGTFGKVIAKNRICMAPMGENMANSDGSISDQVIAYFEARAKGGVGTIFPGVVCVDYPVGKTVAQQLRLDKTNYINGFSRLADAVHRYGTLLIPQLHHAGINTDILTTEGVEPIALCEETNTNQAQLVGTKPKDEYKKSKRKVLSTQDLCDLEQKFITSAKYAQMAGCDGVMLHGGSHYLIGQLLQESTNQRTDKFGGSLENRLRFPVDVIKGIKETCGTNFVVGIRMVSHWEDCEENKIIAQAYEKAGADFLDATFPFEVTRGSQVEETPGYPQGARVQLAANIKKYVSIPVITNGAIKDPDFCEKILSEGKCDFVSLARPLLCDPDWCNKAKSGHAETIRKCLSCLECARNNQFSRGLKCALNPTLGREIELKREPDTKEKKNVVIVGGGIAGMQAAITASQRGHHVVLLEKEDRLGGQMWLASVPPKKDLIKDAVNWFIEECKRQNIEICLNTEANLETIKKYHPDHVILAMGSTPFIAPISGKENAQEVWDVLKDDKHVPEHQKIVIIGGGIVGVETAELLVEKKNEVTILEMKPEMAPDMFWMIRQETLEDLTAAGVEMINNANIEAINEDQSVEYTFNGEKKVIASDRVIIATGQRGVSTELVQQLEEENIAYDIIGDQKRARNFINATREGFFAALNL